MFTNVTSLVRGIALEKAEDTKSYPDLLQKAARDKPHQQIKVGSYLILLGRGGIQQVCGVADCVCLRFSFRPFRAQNEWKPRIQRAEIANVISATSFISYQRAVCIGLHTHPKL
jgi:hypothetical protein